MPNKARVLILNYEYPPIGGGAGVMTQNIAEGLAARGFAVTVVTAWFTGCAEVEESGKLKIIRLKSKRKYSFKSNPFEMLDWLFKARIFLNEYCIQNTFDIALCNFSIPGGVVGYGLKKRFGTPYFILSHGHDIPWFYPAKMFVYHLGLYPIIKTVCKASLGIISLTAKLKQNADKLTGTPDKNKVIPNGIDITLFTPRGNSTGNFNILFAGRLVDQKDPITFLRALALLKEKISFKAQVLGDGELRPAMEELILANGLGQIVELVGKVPNTEMPHYYNAADVYVMTSTHEGMPLTLIEAACSGKYIITTPVSGSDELVQPTKNGQYIPFGDYKALAESLEQAFILKNNAGFVHSETVENIRQSFSAQGVIAQYENLINTFCKDN